MSDLISIIVPVYNVEQYLSRCIDSIIDQTYTNLEIILVDDGSPDRCGEMCEEYAARDKRIKVIHKENGGLSEARNAGIDASSGKYLMFVDSDDYIAPDMVKKLYDALVAADADMSICNFKYIWENADEEDKSFNQNLPIKDEITSSGEVLSHSLFEPKSWFWIVSWNKLYKYELFDNIRFPKGKIHEDEFIAHRIFYKCKRIAGVSGQLYFYWQRKGSIMSERNKDFTAYLNKIEAHMDRALFLYEKGYFDAAARYYKAIVLETGLKYSEMKMFDKHTKEWLITVTKQIRQLYLKMTPKSGFKDFVHYSMFMISPRLYWGYLRLRSKNNG